MRLLFAITFVELRSMPKPQDFSHRSQTPWLKLSAFKAKFLEDGMSEQDILESIEQLRHYNVIDTRGVNDKLEVRFNPNHLEWTAPKKLNISGRNFTGADLEIRQLGRFVKPRKARSASLIKSSQKFWLP